MTTRTVTGNVKTLTDSAVSSGTVTFEKVVTSTTGNTIHQFGTTTATTDGSGDFSIALAVPASGSYRYRMILPNGDAFYFSIASGSSVNVATLIVAETITDSNAIVEALAAYLPLSGGTMTGQLNFSGTTHAGIKLLTLTTAQRDALTPANGMVIYNSTTATVQVYQGGAWASVGGGGASDVDDLTTTTGTSSQMLRVAADGGLEYRTVAQVLDDLQDSGALATTDLGVTVQGYSAKTAAIAALTWAANSIIWLTGAATASVQALAAHVVTFIQSASAADARTAIGAAASGANGDITSITALSTPLTSAQGGTGVNNAGTITNATNTTITGGGTVSLGGFTLTVPATGTAALLATANSFSALQTVSLINSGSGALSLTNSGAAADTYGVRSNAPTGQAVQALTNSGLPMWSLIQAATSTSAVTIAHKFTARASGTPGAGFGQSLSFQLETSTTNDVDTGRLAVLWNTATHASRVPDGVFYLTDSAAEREIWRGRATGSAAAIGFLGATPVARAAHIADPTGGGTVDAESRTAINAILVVLENLGFNATS